MKTSLSDTRFTKLHFSLSLDDAEIRSGLDLSSTLLIYDRRLETLSKEFARFSKQFKARYGVESGEKLKDIKSFPKHLLSLSEIAAELPARKMTVLAVGGGSIGDFAGFFASVFKRGVRLVHMPTTWLAAIDSAHGGKTALNVGGAKNQIGTFYPATDVILVKSILTRQPEARVLDGIGELAKIALIDGGAWTAKLQKSELYGAELLWAGLKPAIAAKMKVVASDPKEKTGHRQILNLGHTFGHVIEAYTGLSHGQAVTQGLFFSLEFSRALGVLSEKNFAAATALTGRYLLPNAAALRSTQSRRIEKQVPYGDLRELLLKDKKRDAVGEVTFVLLRRIGKTERRSVAVADLVREAKRQGWAK